MPCNFCFVNVINKRTKGAVMIEESLLITLMGMGSVFFFLFLLVCSMNLLRVILNNCVKKGIDKEALAIVLALKAKKGK